MNIVGKRIVLRAIEYDDNEILRTMLNDPDIEKMVGGSSWPVSQASQVAWFENQSGSSEHTKRCMIVLKESNQAIGTVILSDIDRENGTAEIHIKMLNNDCRGKGYGEEALKTMVEYAFCEMRLNCIYAKVLEYNEVSNRLFQKCGFEKEGILKSRVYKDGNYINQVSYAITKDANRGISE